MKCMRAILFPKHVLIVFFVSCISGMQTMECSINGMVVIVIYEYEGSYFKIKTSKTSPLHFPQTTPIFFVSKPDFLHPAFISIILYAFKGTHKKNFINISIFKEFKRIEIVRKNGVF